MSEIQTFDWGTWAAWVENLSQQEKTSLVARVAYELTIAARESYEPATRGVIDPGRLRALNEVMHRLTRRTLSTVSQENWSEAEFWEALLELSEQGGCVNDLVIAASIASRTRVGA